MTGPGSAHALATYSVLRMFAVSCSWFRMTDTKDLFDAKEREFGIHGGEAETSVMLHLHRDLIDMQYAENFVPKSVEIKEAVGRLTPEERIYILARARMLASYSKAVEEAVGSMK